MLQANVKESTNILQWIVRDKFVFRQPLMHILISGRYWKQYTVAFNYC